MSKAAKTLQAICMECKHEIWRGITDEDYIICPECGAGLNQQSSEDASEGEFRNERQCELPQG